MHCLSFNMLSSEEPGIDRPRARSDHGQRAPKDCQYEGQFITGAGQDDPHLDDHDQHPRQGCP